MNLTNHHSSSNQSNKSTPKKNTSANNNDLSVSKATTNGDVFPPNIAKDVSDSTVAEADGPPGDEPDEIPKVDPKLKSNFKQRK